MAISYLSQRNCIKLNEVKKVFTRTSITKWTQTYPSMTEHNTIYIVGTGAIGKVLAVFLKLEGKNVVLLRGSVDNKPRHVEKIVVDLIDGKKFEAEIEISTLSNFSVLNGLVVLTNKSFGNAQLSTALQTKINNSPLVLLQNGLNVEQPFLDKNFAQIYRCVLFATSQPISEYQLRFRPVAVSPIGVMKGDAGDLTNIVAQLHTNYFPFQADHDIQPVIWTKAIINSVFNSVCPLLETDNGIFYRNESALNIAKRVIAEGVSIAEAQGISLDVDKVVNSLLLISKASDGQLISTYQDIKNGRKTEIESLNFAIVKAAHDMKKEALVGEMKLLGELTKLKSDIHLEFKHQ